MDMICILNIYKYIYTLHQDMHLNEMIITRNTIKLHLCRKTHIISNSRVFELSVEKTLVIRSQKYRSIGAAYALVDNQGKYQNLLKLA